MSVNSQDTYVNILTPLTVVGTGGGGLTSSFSTIYVSTANVDYLNVLDINNFFLSTQIVEAEEIYASSISTLGIYLDGSLLTTVGNELLLNGIPIATTSNISSLADWSYDPAISTLNMNNNSSINGSLTSTTNIHAGNGLITNLVCSDISTNTLTVQSTIHVISTLSSLEIEAQVAIFSSINGVQFPQSQSSFGSASVSSLTASSINGLSYPPPNSDVSQWATFRAVSTITGGVGATDDLAIVTGRNLGINARVSTAIVVDRGADVGGNASFNVVTQNGNRGQINLTANAGAAGIYGEVNITANGGTTPGLIGSGGLVNITANTPIGTDPAATSAIKFSAAGINSYAGAIPSVGSLLGYNFVYGTLGVNLCAGIPSIFPNIPGTTFLYGTTGITLGAQTNTASDITQSAGGIYTTLLTGYWPGGIFAPSNLVIRGRQIPIYGNSYVQISNVDVLNFDSGGVKAITGLSTINGAAYPPTQAGVPPDLVVSTLVAGVQISTPSLLISSINGGVYPPVFEPPANAVVSTLTAVNYVSTGFIYGLSTLYGQSATNNIIFEPGGGLTFNNDGQDMVIDSAGSLQVRTDLFIPSNELLVSSIRGVSSINGSAYPPVFEPPANAVVSTLAAATSVSTPELFVSSVNGASYPPTASVPANLVVSSLTAAVDVITLALNADIINGNAANTPIVSSLTSQSVSTSALFVSSINNSAYPPTFAPPVDLVVSTLTAATSVSTVALKVSTINNYQPNRPVVSSLNVGPKDQAGSDFEAGIHTYAPIYLQDEGADNINNGVLTLRRTTGSYTEPNSAPILSAFTVDAFSTLGATLPIVASRIYLNNGPGATAIATPISGDTAGNIVIPFSSIIGISTINGAAYPPPVASGIQSTIANGGSFVDIDSGGNISSYSGGRTSITANSGGVHLIDSDNVTTLDVMFDITMTPTTGAAVRINQAPLYVSSVYLSSVNGAIYPPPSAGGSPNAEFSTVTVSSFVSVPQLTNVSSINDVILNGGDIGAKNVTADTGFTLAGAGTFTINGSTGGEGQVIQIVDGYPEWTTPVRPSAYYSTSTESLPVYSTFSTIVSQSFTTQLSTGTCLVTGNVTILNGDIIGDTLTTNIFLTGSGAGTAISTTGGFAAGYQNISLQYLIPQASLSPPGTANVFEINIKKPDTDNSYTVTYATISVTTDLN